MRLLKRKHTGLKKLLLLSGGTALLVLIVLALQGQLPFGPSLALNTQSQTAAVWQAYWGESSCGGACGAYSGMPSPHYYNMIDNWPPGSGACYPSYSHCHYAPDQCLWNGTARVGAFDASGQAGGSGAALVTQNGVISGAGSASVPSGGNLTLEWACQDYQNVGHAYAGSNSCYGLGYNTHMVVASSVTVTGPSGVEYTGGTLVGSKVVHPVGAPGSVAHYTLTCAGNGSWTISVPVTLLAGAPTLSIKGNATNPTSVIVGDKVTVAGTYTAGENDKLTGTILNDYQNKPLAGVDATPPTSKSYIFTPNAPGSYVFYPSVQTQSYTTWSNYGASLTVTATCPADQVNKGGTCAYVCPAGSHKNNAPSCNKCDSGYVMRGSSCVVDDGDSCTNIPGIQTAILSNSTQDPFGSCICNKGYELSGNSCKILGTIGSFSANPARLQAGQSATLAWSTSNMSSCIVKDSAGTTVATGVSSSGTPSPAINNTVIYTLSCKDALSHTYSSSVTVGLIPKVIEI